MNKQQVLGFFKFGLIVSSAALLGCGEENGDSVVSGQIFVDSNENGFFDADESPMSGVKVVLRSRDDENETREPFVTTTNDSGVYRFDVEEFGGYELFQDLEIGARNISNLADYSDSGDLPPLGQRAQAIVGGQNASPGEYPFMAGLVRPFRTVFPTFCGGTLISDKYVVTAAHCVLGEEPGEFQVSLGGLRRNAGTLYEVSDVIIHSEYSTDPRRAFQGYDIALVELEERVDLEAGDLFTLELAKEVNSDLLEADGLATVIGWGDIDEGVSASLDIPLQEAHFPFVETDQCRRTYPSLGASELVVCAGADSGGVDSCQGDSGGPLLVWDDEESQWLHAGVVSGGFGCARQGIPGVYTRTPGYQGWLEEIIDETSSPSVAMTLVGGDEARVNFANKLTMRSVIGESEERRNP